MGKKKKFFLVAAVAGAVGLAATQAGKIKNALLGKKKKKDKHEDIVRMEIIAEMEKPRKKSSKKSSKKKSSKKSSKKKKSKKSSKSSKKKKSKKSSKKSSKKKSKKSKK